MKPLLILFCNLKHFLTVQQVDEILFYRMLLSGMLIVPTAASVQALQNKYWQGFIVFLGSNSFFRAGFKGICLCFATCQMLKCFLLKICNAGKDRTKLILRLDGWSFRWSIHNTHISRPNSQMFMQQCVFFPNTD